MIYNKTIKNINLIEISLKNFFSLLKQFPNFLMNIKYLFDIYAMRILKYYKKISKICIN